MALREELIKIEKDSKIDFYNFRMLIEHQGMIINFDHLNKDIYRYRPVKMMPETWRKYIDLCKEYQDELRRNKFMQLDSLTDEDIRVIQEGELNILNDKIMMLENLSNNTRIQQYFSRITDYSDSLEDRINYRSTPHEDELSFRRRDDVINTIAATTLYKYQAKAKEQTYDRITDGPSKKHHDELLEILKKELERMQSMTPAQFKMYKVELLQPSKEELQLISSTLEQGRTY